MRFCLFECLSLSVITLVSALMCARRQLPPSDAGGLQLSNLVASMGRHLIPARRSSQETGPPKTPTSSNCSHTGRQTGGVGFCAGGGFGRGAKEPLDFLPAVQIRNKTQTFTVLNLHQKTASFISFLARLLRCLRIFRFMAAQRKAWCSHGRLQSLRVPETAPGTGRSQAEGALPADRCFTRFRGDPGGYGKTTEEFYWEDWEVTEANEVRVSQICTEREKVQRKTSESSRLPLIAKVYRKTGKDRTHTCRTDTYVCERACVKPHSGERTAA